MDPFVDFVSLAGFLVSAAAAVGLTWRRRAKWEPSIHDVPNAPARVGGLLTSLFLGAMWFDQGASFGLPSLQSIVIWGGAAALAGLLTYVYLTTVYIYLRERAVSADKTEQERIIGGLWLTRQAKVKSRAGTDIQRLLAEAGNNPDQVWPRSARAIAQSLFILSYLALVCGGTIALSAVVLLIQPSR